MNPNAKRAVVWALVLLVLLVALVGVRRWVHHAQLELIPVIIAQDMPAGDALRPPPGAIVRRMIRDVAETLRPPQRARYAVLTFDDGPFPVATPALLAELQALHVPADFFLIGRDAQEQPAIAQRLPGSVNEIGNHTLSHPHLPALAFPAQLEEISDGATAIRHVTAGNVVYFRPPHGDWDANTLSAARAAGETMVLWNVDPGDWRRVTPRAIIANVTQYARSPAVILLHNGSEPTIEALPAIVAAYRRAGFTFVTLSQLQQRLTLDEINDPLKVKVAVAQR